MKVILLQELKGRGGEGDVIEVARGFAVNYLLPRSVAIEATPGNLKQLEQRRHNIAKREDARMGDASALSQKLSGATVTIHAKVGDEGRLFGSVTALMVEDAIREQLGIEIDRRKIETHGHIKEVGPHQVEVQIYRDVKAPLTVDVVPEGTVATTVVEVVEGVSADGEAFVEVVEETPEQVADETALEQATDEEAAELDAAEAAPDAEAGAEEAAE